ncbi:MAG: hypothetical protein ABJE95_19980 [Byssovorax sp.]
MILHVLTWLLIAVLLGAQIHALVALAWVAAGRAKPPIQRRKLAVRCAASALVLIVVSVVAGGASIAAGWSSGAVDPSQRATLLANFISEVLNCLAAVVLGSAFPLVAALVLALLARRAARQSAGP